MCMCLFDICYMHAWRGPIYYLAQPDDWAGARCRMGSEVGWSPMTGRGPLYVDCMYGMWYFGEITNLCAYGFQFMFQVIQFSK